MKKLLAAWVFLAFSTCSTPDVSQDEVGKRQASLAECTDAALPISDGTTCRGPWEYYPIACPELTTYQTCRVPAFGFPPKAEDYVFEVKRTVLVEHETWEGSQLIPSGGCVTVSDTPSSGCSEYPDDVTPFWDLKIDSAKAISKIEFEVLAERCSYVPVELCPPSLPVHYKKVALTPNDINEINHVLHERFRPAPNPNPGQPSDPVGIRLRCDILSDEFRVDGHYVSASANGSAADWAPPLCEGLYGAYASKVLKKGTWSKYEFSAPNHREKAEPPCAEIFPKPLDIPHCTVATQPQYSAPALTELQLTLQYSSLSDEGKRLPPPDLIEQVSGSRATTCTTVDKSSFAAQADARKKFDEVASAYRRARQNLPMATREAALTSILSEVVTLFLLKPEHFDGPRVAELTSLMAEWPAVGGACGKRFAALKAIFALPLGSTTDDAKEVEANARLQLLTGILRTPAPEPEAPRKEELRDRIALIGAWYQRATDPSAPIVVVNRDRDDENVVNAFWGGAYAPEFAKLKTLQDEGGDATTKAKNITDRSAALQEIFKNNFAVDRQVLEALFPPLVTGASTALPLGGAMGARLTAAALTGVTERLRVLGAVRDFACTFEDCATLSSPTAQMWHAFASLLSESELGANASRLSILDPWRTVFQGIHARHASFMQMVQSVADAEASDEVKATQLFNRSLENLPSSIRGLMSIIRMAQHRSESVKKSATLEIGARNTLSYSLNDLKLGSPSVDGVLQNTLAELSTKRSEVSAQRDQLLLQFIKELGDAKAQKATQRQVGLVIEDQNQKGAELRAIRRHLRDDETSRQEFLRTFASAVENETDPQQLIVKREHTFSAPASGTRTTAGNDIRQLAIAGLSPVAVTAGEFLEFSTAGTWSPSCAIQADFSKRADAARSVDPARNYTVEYAETGPEGYHVTTATDSSLTVGESDSDTTSTAFQNSTSLTLCLRDSIGTPEALKFLYGATAYFTIDGCNQTSFSYTGTHSNTATGMSSDGVRSSAAFESGIRVPGTPSATHPAGSLLLVVMPKGATNISAALDVRVVHQRDGVLLNIPNVAANAPTPEFDLYFVVNDSGCSTASGALTVTMRRFETLGSKAQVAGRKMVEALTTVRSEANRFANQGVVLPSEISLLKDNARVSVGAALSQMPPILRDLFELWLTGEAVRLERMVEIGRRDREMARLNTSLEDLRDALGTGVVQNTLASQLTYWRVQALEQAGLERAIYSLAQGFAGRLYPVARLRNSILLDCYRGNPPPGSAPGLTQDCSDTNAKFRQLAALELNVPLFDVASKVYETASFARGVIPSFDAQLNLPIVEAAIRMPNPFVVFCSQSSSPPGCVTPIRNASEDEIVEQSRTNAKSMTAHAFWSALLDRRATGDANGPTPSFRITAEDLYSKAGLTHSLPCNEGAPVIRQMAVVVANSGEGAIAINNAQLIAKVQQDTLFEFPTSQGAEHFEVTAPQVGDGSFNTPVISSKYDTYMVTYKDLKSQNPGRMTVPFSASPFTTYQLQFSGPARGVMGSQLTNAPEAYLVFSLEILPFSSMNWITTCK